MIQQYDTYEQYKVKRKIMMKNDYFFRIAEQSEKRKVLHRFTLPQNEPDTMQRFDIFSKHLIYNSKIPK